MMAVTWLWAGFVLVMGVMLALDLGILQKKAHTMRLFYNLKIQFTKAYRSTP